MSKFVKLHPTTIVFDGQQYHKVDRKAREGDVVVFKQEFKFKNPDLNRYETEKPYKVVNGECNRPSFLNDYGDVWPVYFLYGVISHTPENVDVYESVKQSEVEQTCMSV